MRVGIVGAGIAGLSLAWWLRRSGADVTVFDQGAIPNPIASSFDEHRITRHTYAGLEGYGVMMPAAFEAYDTLWEDLGRSRYLPTGIVYLSRLEGGLYEAAAEELEQLGIRHRRLSPGEMELRLPMLESRGIREAFEAEGSGMLFASRIVTDLARWLAEHGADLRPRSEVTGIDPDRGRLEAGGEWHAFDQVIVAAGAWLSTLLPQTRNRLVASRQLVIYLDPPTAHAPAWRSAPVIVDVGAEHGIYVLPPRGGARLKFGDHKFTRRGHGSDDRVATLEDAAPVRAALDAILRDVEAYRVLEEKVCYYTVTTDERFVVEELGKAAWLLSACSGHGFKLAPAVTQRLAESSLGRRSPGEVTRWAAGSEVQPRVGFSLG